MKLNPLLIALLLTLAACSAEPEAQKAAAITVDGDRALLAEPDKATFLKLATVEKDKGGWLRLPGRLVWNEEKTVRILPQVAGRVQGVAVDVGAPVKTGQRPQVQGGQPAKPAPAAKPAPKQAQKGLDPEDAEIEELLRKRGIM